MSSRSINGINSSMVDLQNSISNDFTSLRKAVSLIFNRNTSTTENASNTTEMLEFIPHDTSAISLEFPNVQEKESSWRKKLRCRLESNSNEKNTGYLMISNPESDPILISDQKATRNAYETSAEVNNTTFNPENEKIQYSTMQLPVQDVSSSDGAIIAPQISTRNLGVHETGSGAQCITPHDDSLGISISAQHSTVSSIVLTNVSDHEYTNVDRSQLSDEQYVDAQQKDLHQLYDIEIELSKELSRLEYEIEDELQTLAVYELAVKLNTDLKKEKLQLLQENDPSCSLSTSNICTSENQSFENSK